MITILCGVSVAEAPVHNYDVQSILWILKRSSFSSVSYLVIRVTFNLYIQMCSWHLWGFSSFQYLMPDYHSIIPVSFKVQKCWPHKENIPNKKPQNHQQKTPKQTNTHTTQWTESTEKAACNKAQLEQHETAFSPCGTLGPDVLRSSDFRGKG